MDKIDKKMIFTKQNLAKDIYNEVHRKQITYEDLAKKIGKSRSHVAKIVSGENSPSFETFIEICKTLNVTPNYFLYKYIDIEEHPNIGDGLLRPNEEKVITALIEALISTRDQNEH